MMWKESAVDNFNVSYGYFHGRTELSHEEPQVRIVGLRAT
jgi:hypothetical protein